VTFSSPPAARLILSESTAFDFFHEAARGNHAEHFDDWSNRMVGFKTATPEGNHKSIKAAAKRDADFITFQAFLRSPFPRQAFVTRVHARRKNWRLRLRRPSVTGNQRRKFHGE
jgi:hypothetical protein